MTTSVILVATSEIWMFEGMGGHSAKGHWEKTDSISQHWVGMRNV